MRHTTIPNVALATWLSFCSGPTKTPDAPAADVVHSYSATEGSLRASTLVIDGDGRRLAGVTHFADGSCLAEEATLDHAGRLVRAQYAVTGASGASTHVLLDSPSGVVEITGPTGTTRMTVPNDWPWVYTPQLDPAANSQAVATPLAAVLTMRAARADRSVRAVELGAHKSYRVSSNQLLVKDEDQSDLIVVGDDVVAIERGLPQQWHLWALDQDLQARESDGLLSTLAAFACTPVEASAT
jgi:hypothetical protein